MKIIITTWGDYTKWSEIEYRYKDQIQKSNTSLKVILETQKPDKIIIVLLDTLINSLQKNKKEIPYSEILNIIQTQTLNFCKEKLNFEPEILISYGVGKFSQFQFLGSSMDFYYDILFQLTREILKILPESGNFEFIFDITHGLNFTVNLTYKALIKILQILAIFYKINFTMLNSEPYTKDANIQTLTIHQIEMIRELSPSLIFYKSNKGFLELNDLIKQNQDDSLKLKEKFDLKIKKKSIHLFLGAFSFGLPIHTYQYLIEPNKLNDSLEKLKNFYKNSIINQNFIIQRIYRYTINFENLIFAYLLSSLLAKKNIFPKEEVTLEDIQNLKNIIQRYNQIYSNRIDKEMDDIKKIEDLISEDYKLYNQIIGKNLKQNIDKRNFFAHSGFEHNSIKLKKDKQLISITLNKDLQEEIENLIQSNLNIY